MFNRIRLRLTAWYVAVLLLIVIATGVISYTMLSSALRSEVDDSLRRSAANIAAQIDEDALRAVTGPSNGRGDDPEDDDDHDEPEHLRFFSAGAGDTFYLVLSPEGQLLFNPLNLNLPGITDSAAAVEAVQSGEAWRTVSSEGSSYRTYLFPVMDRGRPVAVVEVGRSLSEHDRQLSTALLVLAASGAAGLVLAAGGGLLVAGRALTPIRQSFSRQREFVADASHELRTPLTLVRGNAELLEASGTARLAGDDRELLRSIVREVEHMERLVGDLSLLARMDEADLPLNPEPLVLSEIIEDVARQGRVLAGTKPLMIDASSQPHLRVEGDETRLRQLLLILVDNAVRVTPEGGAIRIRGRQQGGFAEVEVSDTGPGIAPEHQGRVFERFYRMDKSRARAYGGSGLGLSIAKGIAEAHGGSLVLSSQPNSGATFTLRLPAFPDSPIPERGPDAAEPSSTSD